MKCMKWIEMSASNSKTRSKDKWYGLSLAHVSDGGKPLQMNARIQSIFENWASFAHWLHGDYRPWICRVAMLVCECVCRHEILFSQMTRFPSFRFSRFFFYFLLFIQWQIIFAALGTISDDGGWWMGTATTHWLVAIYPCHVSITSSKSIVLPSCSINATYGIFGTRAREHCVLFLRHYSFFFSPSVCDFRLHIARKDTNNQRKIENRRKTLE